MSQPVVRPPPMGPPPPRPLGVGPAPAGQQPQPVVPQKYTAAMDYISAAEDAFNNFGIDFSKKNGPDKLNVAPPPPPPPEQIGNKTSSEPPPQLKKSLWNENPQNNTASSNSNVHPAARNANYEQKNNQPGGNKKNDKNNAKVEEIDDTEDFSHCKICDVKFEDQKSFQRHCRGMIHTAKVLSMEKSAGSTDVRPPDPKVEEFKVSDAVKRKYEIDPNRRDLAPDEIGDKTFDSRWFCNLCNVTATSEATFQTHIEGKRHVKAMKSRVQATKDKQILTKGERVTVKTTGDRPFIQDKIDSYHEPIIGLTYMVEYISPCSEPRYVCNLCAAKCDANTVIPHLVGFKHRLRYLKEIRSDLYAEIQLYSSDKQMQNEILLQRTKELEKKDGRPYVQQKLEVMASVMEMKAPKAYEDTRMERRPATFDLDGTHGEREVFVRAPTTPGKGKKKKGAGAVVSVEDPNLVPVATNRRFITQPPEPPQRSWNPPPAPEKRYNYDDYGPPAKAPAIPSRSPDFAQYYAERRRKEKQIEEQEASNAVLSKGTMKALLNSLANSAVQNEEDAAMAFQISNALTQALLKYRLDKAQQDSDTKVPMTTLRPSLRSEDSGYGPSRRDYDDYSSQYDRPGRNPDKPPARSSGPTYGSRTEEEYMPARSPPRSARSPPYTGGYQAHYADEGRGYNVDMDRREPDYKQVGPPQRGGPRPLMSTEIQQPPNHRSSLMDTEESSAPYGRRKPDDQRDEGYPEYEDNYGKSSGANSGPTSVYGRVETGGHGQQYGRAQGHEVTPGRAQIAGLLTKLGSMKKSGSSGGTGRLATALGGMISQQGQGASKRKLGTGYM